MDDQVFRDLVLQLSGPARDRSRLATLLGISESTAYGWIRLADEGRFSQATSVRGDQNRVAKGILIDAAGALASGVISSSELEGYIRDRVPQTAEPEPRPMASVPLDETYRRSSLLKGLEYVIARSKAGATTDELLAAVEAVVAMNKEAR